MQKKRSMGTGLGVTLTNHNLDHTQYRVSYVKAIPCYGRAQPTIAHRVRNSVNIDGSASESESHYGACRGKNLTGSVVEEQAQGAVLLCTAYS